MFKQLLAALVFFIPSFICTSILAADDGFVPVDPATLDTVSGKTLMISSYAVIIGILFLYVVKLLLQDRRLIKSIKMLKQQLRK